MSLHHQQPPVAFVVLYGGKTVATAHLIAASSDPTLVSHVASQLGREFDTRPAADPLADALMSGRRRALRLLNPNQEGTDRD